MISVFEAGAVGEQRTFQANSQAGAISIPSMTLHNIMTPQHQGALTRFDHPSLGGSTNQLRL